MPQVRIANKNEYKVGNEVIATCTINERWWAFFKNNVDIRASGDSESEAIGNLILSTKPIVVKVA